MSQCRFLRTVSLFLRTLSATSAILLVACFALPAQAKVWHVAQGRLPGIAAHSRVDRIGQAVKQLAPGDTVLIHGGVYREQIKLSQSGMPDQAIVLKAVEGENVVITGADRITEWAQVPGAEHIYSTHWPHRFISWNEHNSHPNDDYHRLIGRCEQVFSNGYPLQQVLERDKLGRGMFYVDMDAPRLYIRLAYDTELSERKTLIEGSVRERLLLVEGDHVRVEGIRFRYAANRAQQGAVQFTGDHITVKNCRFEYSNACGAAFSGQHITVRNCLFQHNGQLGFSANRAHGLHLNHCTVRNNNTKGFNRNWEAGGNKICLTRDAIMENSRFVENRGHGIWFDIGNEACVVHNCFIAHNENAGIFYEISYGLHAHDNVILGNGFAFTPGAWGAAAGISLSSSPDCTIERNLLLGNKEGFNFREQLRTTPRINGSDEPVWNHHDVIQNNVLAFNRDAQVWGWFDIPDERHWPRSVQAASSATDRAHTPSPASAHPTDLSLEDLNIVFKNNLYWPGPVHDLFNWGVTWKKHERYDKLETLHDTLSFGQGSCTACVHFADYFGLDLRLPANSPALQMNCYPKGQAPNVRLGTLP
jgi:hypothetical protein